ncbi:MAG TPA: efflux RND transporter permease subunit [Bacteroidales bacterium]|nr:efflux RND transporter permease subunit [Bacteroidales bacterium]
MAIYKSAINKPVTTILLFVAILVVGLFSFSRLPIDQFPDIEAPYITVMTTYPGASSSEVETNVTKVLENTLNSVDDLDELTSTSKDNMSLIMLKLKWGTNLDEVINDVRSYIDLTKDYLPTGCSNPFIFKFSTSMMPIIMFAVTADESYAGLDKILNDQVVPQLNQVDGIGNISISGSPIRYVYIDLDQEQMDAYGISLEQVGSAISSNNLNVSSGTVKMDKEQYALQVRSEYVESEEIADIVVKTTMDGRQVFVRDIAQVKDTIKDLTLDEKVNGQNGVRLVIAKQSGANTVQVASDVQKQLENIKSALPSDIEISVIYDSAETIKDSIYSLEESIMFALLFVVLVVLFFLGRWRATLIIALTIPIALVGSFVYLAFVDSSLNIISLSSLTVAIGLVVDDAIVVLENIIKHIERGSTPREAAVAATNEVWVSVIATTLVIIAVFLPLTMLGGMAGIMFKELGWIVTIVIAISAIVAISLTPMLASRILRKKKVAVDSNGHIIEEKEKSLWYDRSIGRMLHKLDLRYANILRWCLNHKKLTMLIVVVFFVVSLIPALTGQIGTDFMQQSDGGRLTVTAELQRGTRLEETMKTARRLESRFMEIAPEIKIISTTVGSSDEATISAMFSTATNNKISMTVVCSDKSERKRSIFEIAEVLRQEMLLYPELTTFQAQVAGMMGGGIAGTSTVNVEIYGYDFDQTAVMAETVKKAISENVKGARDITISREPDRPELKVVVDKQKLAMHGLSSSAVSMYVRNRVLGMNAGFLKEEGEEYDIVVRMKEENRNSISAILNLSIPTPSGGKIKLSEIARVEEFWTPQTITRKSRQRIVTVAVTPYKTSLGELAAGVKDELKNIEVPNGITLNIGGDYQEQQETFADMTLFMLLIIMLVFIVMASQFESFKKPFIIMASVFFAFSGIILALFITGTTLDMIGALGAIMLVGIVVKNGIVLVDYTNLMRDRGYELKEAIALSGQSRLRPVLMTALTAILGMVPMAISTGAGSEMWRPMGIVIIGGLTVSMFLTLIVVPVLYGIMSRHGERDETERQRKEFIFMEISDETSTTSKN